MLAQAIELALAPAAAELTAADDGAIARHGQRRSLRSPCGALLACTRLSRADGATRCTDGAEVGSPHSTDLEESIQPAYVRNIPLWVHPNPPTL